VGRARGNAVTERLPSPPSTVPIDLRDRPAWMLGIVLARPGTIFENPESGERLQLAPDGSLKPVGVRS